MVAWASAIEMGQARFPRARRGVEVLAMPDARLDTTPCVESVCEVSPCAGVVQLPVHSMAVSVIIDRRRVVDGVTVMC
jgi:hypothetical protein